MANRYWVGGSGTWASTGTTNWSTTSGGASGASAPTTADAVIFDANSNTGTDDFTVTLGTNPACLSLTTTGIDPANAMTVAGTGTLTLAGAFTLTNKVVWSHTGTLNFAPTSNVALNITTAGVTLNCAVSMNPNGASPNFTFVDNFTTTGTFTLVRGSLISTGSNKTLTALTFLTSGTSGKTVALGASATINITGNNATVLDLATGTSITWSSPSAVNLTYAGSTGTRTVSLTGSVFNSRTLNVSAGSDTFTLTASNALSGLNFTGFSGTWSNVAISVGNLTVSSGMTVGAGAGVVTFNQTGTVTTSGQTLDFPVTINGAGITTTLADSLTLGSTRTATLTQGTLALGANTLSAGIFSSSGGSTLAITRTTGGITLTGNNATILTLTGGAATYGTTPFTCIYAGGTGTRTFNTAGNLTNPVSITGGTDTVTFTANNSIGTLDFTGFAGTWTNVALTIRSGALTLSSGMTLGSGSGTLTLFGNFTLDSLGKTFDFPVTKSSANTLTLGADLTLGSTRTFTLSQGTVVLGANNLSAGLFSSTGTSTRSVTRTTGNITLTGNGATVLALTGSNATYGAGLAFTCNYAGSTGTRTFNVTDVNPEIDITAGSDIVTFTANNAIGNLDFTGFSGTWSNVVMSLASLTLSTGMTVTAGANTVTFARTGTLTSNGKTLDFPVTINGAGITATIGDTLSIGTTRVLNLTNGTLDFNNQNASIGTFTSQVVNPRVLTLGSGTITVNGSGTDAWVNVGATVTANTATIRMTSASAKRFAGGGSTWHVLENAGAGALTISNNNTFTTISNSVQPTTFTFTAGTTQTVTNFNVNGTAGNLVTIQSSTAGTQATLSKASGTVSVSYCSIKDSNATGGASWYAETALGNVDAGNNTGWVFVRVNYEVTADNGTYAVTGQAADLSKTKVIFADNGTYALAGQTANLLKTRILTADNGAYAVTGQTASLLRSKVVTANNGVYTTTGISATIDKSRLFTANPGFYAVTGEQAAITFSGAPIVVSEEFLIKLRSFTERRRF